MNFANFLTISRVILILPVLFFISEDSGLNNWLALFLFVSAGVTDNLDGYIARKTGTESFLGALLDLLADKLLVIITTAYLISYQTHENLLIPAFHPLQTFANPSWLFFLMALCLITIAN